MLLRGWLPLPLRIILNRRVYCNLVVAVATDCAALFVFVIIVLWSKCFPPWLLLTPCRLEMASARSMPSNTCDCDWMESNHRDMETITCLPTQTKMSLITYLNSTPGLSYSRGTCRINWPWGRKPKSCENTTWYQQREFEKSPQTLRGTDFHRSPPPTCDIVRIEVVAVPEISKWKNYKPRKEKGDPKRLW